MMLAIIVSSLAAISLPAGKAYADDDNGGDEITCGPHPQKTFQTATQFLYICRIGRKYKLYIGGQNESIPVAYHNGFYKGTDSNGVVYRVNNKLYQESGKPSERVINVFTFNNW